MRRRYFPRIVHCRHTVAAMVMYKACILACLLAPFMTECNADIISDVDNLRKEYRQKGISFSLDTSTPICKILGGSGFTCDVTIGDLWQLLRHAPDIPPSPLHLEYRDLGQLKHGDVVVIHSLYNMWKTYAIVSNAKEKKVICFATPNGRPVYDIVALLSTEDVYLQEVSLDELDHGVLEVVQQENHAETLQNARDALAHGSPWRLFDFNSEHFVTRAVTGKAQSSQISVHIKAVLSGTIAGLMTPEGFRFLRGLGKAITIAKKLNVLSSSALDPILQISKKKVTDQVISGSTKAVASQVAKQTAKEATEEVVGATAVTATSKLAKGAKAGLLGGVVVEIVSLTYTGYSSYQKVKNGELSLKDHQRHMVKRIGAAVGSIGGGIVGAAVGSVIFPGAGTVAGGIVGGMAGDHLGSKFGEKIYDYAFSKNST